MPDPLTEQRQVPKTSTHRLAPLERRELPSPPHWRQAFGVGIVVMGLAMGTGELILWPHLILKHGFGLLWLAVIGISAQFVINREVARLSLATGESFFTASARRWPWTAGVWLVSAILIYIWPGWASAIGTILATLFGIGSAVSWGWVALGLVLVLTFAGRRAYSILEHGLKITVPVFFIILLLVSVLSVPWSVWLDAFRAFGQVGRIPAGVDPSVLLGAIVFAGAGGMLNLTVGLWYRDKKFGMGAYAGTITNPVTGRDSVVHPIGATFEPTESALVRWRGWLKYVTIDQGLIFWLLGTLTLMMLSVNAYAALHPHGIVPDGTGVAVAQARIFRDLWGAIGEKGYLAMAALMLFSVLWTILDALTRMVTDILYTQSHAGSWQKFGPLHHLSLGKLYYLTITIVIVVGAILLPFRQPLVWLTLAGVLGGITMAVYVPALLFINSRHLPASLRPGWAMRTAIGLIGLGYIGAATYTLWQLF